MYRVFFKLECTKFYTAAKLLDNEKPIEWVGGSLSNLIGFPEGARQQAGFQLHRIQHDLEPEHWKPFSQVGPGVKEIILSEEGDAFRVMYVAKFEEAVYVQHSFQKKTRQTTKQDKAIAIQRYKDVLLHRDKKRGKP